MDAESGEKKPGLFSDLNWIPRNTWYDRDLHRKKQ